MSLRHELGEAVVEHRVDETLFVPEVVIERRCLHTSALAHRPCGHRPVARLRQQLCCSEKQAISGTPGPACHSHSAILLLVPLYKSM